MIAEIAFQNGDVPDEAQETFKTLVSAVVGLIKGTINVLDFWRKPIEVKRLRGDVDTEILLAGIPALDAKHERIAVEIVKLAEKRHEELTK